MITLLICILLFWWISITIAFWVGLILGILYAKYSYFDQSEKNGNREWNSFKKLKLWKKVKEYFDFKIEYEDRESILKDTAYIYAIFPHGVLSLSHVLGFAIHGGISAHPHGEVRPLAHKLLFAVPLVRDFILWAGAVDTTKENYKRFLTQRQSISVVPGGVRELLLTRRESIDIYKGHKGFITMAFENNDDIIPVFA